MQKRAMSLLELLISSVLLLVTVSGIAVFIQRSATIAAGERGGIDLQQNRRGAEREITRSLLLAGRGGMPAGRELPDPVPPEGVPYRLPQGLAIHVDNNVAENRHVLESEGDSPLVAIGTDILTVRAVRGTLYRLDKNALSRDLPTAVQGKLIVPRRADQDLGDLEDLIEKKYPAALLIGSAADADTYGLAELDADSSVVGAEQIELAFYFFEPGNPDSDTDRPAKAYGDLGPKGVFPLELFRQGAATLGILSEYRYYIHHRPLAEVPQGEDPSDLLVRAEVYPGLDRAWADDAANLKLEIALGITDLQIALGFDTNLGGQLADGDGLLQTADGKNDDWLWNAPDEKADEAPFENLSPWALKEIEVSLLARSPWPDRSHNSAEIDHLGDRPSSELNSDIALRYRRAVVTWRTQLRNL